LIAYLNGVNFRLEKCVAGVYTSLISVANAAVTNAIIRVITYHSGASLKVRCYVNNVFLGAEITVSDAGIIGNTIHGCFSTYSGNTFDNLVIFARGSDGEYAELDKY